MTALSNQISSISSKACMKEICTYIEKTDCIFFDATTLIQMLLVLSKTVKVTYVAIVEKFRGYLL